MKQMTDNTMSELVAQCRKAGMSVENTCRAAISHFCRINGITGEAQPAEQAKGREAAALMDECLVAIHAAACTLGNFGSYFFGCSRQVGLRQDQVEQYQEMHRKAEEGVNSLMDLHDQLRGLQPDHTTPPAQPAREWMSDLGFELKEEQGVWLLVDDCGNEREATLTERVLWDELIKKNAGLPAAVPDNIPAILKKQAS